MRGARKWNDTRQITPTASATALFSQKKIASSKAQSKISN